MSALCRACNGTGREPDGVAVLRADCTAMGVAVLSYGIERNLIALADLPKLIPIALKTAYAWSSGAQPIPVLKIAGKVFVRLADIDDWLRKN